MKEEQIVLPESPYWEVCKRFGRDELIALGVGAVATGVVGAVVDNPAVLAVTGPISVRTQKTIISCTSPVFEKAGFFPGHFSDAYKAYKSTPKSERDSLSTYFKRAVKNGSKSLLEDVLVHDPLYIGLMFGGMTVYPGAPVWMLSAFSFGAAVGMVAAGEVGVTEFLFHKYCKSLKRKGFEKEDYYESRFLLDKSESPRKVLDQIANEFDTGESQVLEYDDTYYDCCLPFYNGRTPKIRVRSRDNEKGGKSNSIQVIFTKASELIQRNPGQFRYFPTRKEKCYLATQDPVLIPELGDYNVKRVLDRAITSDVTCKVNFQRRVSHDSDTLLASVDELKHGRPFYVLELKVRKDKSLLKSAMKYVMRNFTLDQTTRDKYCLAINNSLEIT